MNCSVDGRFMRKGIIDDSPLEDSVVQWWFCSCGNDYPEHLYFKSSLYFQGEKVKG